MDSLGPHARQCNPFRPPAPLPVRNRGYTAGEFGLDGTGGRTSAAVSAKCCRSASTSVPWPPYSSCGRRSHHDCGLRAPHVTAVLGIPRTMLGSRHSRLCQAGVRVFDWSMDASEESGVHSKVR